MPADRGNNDYAPLPSTLRRSPKKAQDTYERTLERAEHEYGNDQARAHRVAWSAVKLSYEKIGDRWIPKKHRGPSDPRAEQGGPNAAGRSFGGVNANKTKAELVNDARQVGVSVSMHDGKALIAQKIQRANTSLTRAHRRGEKRNS